MLFRTKFVAAIAALAFGALACGGLLLLSAQRSEVNQTRSTLAHESLSGYFQVYGAVFRTFKQARRDLISGAGGFAFDLEEAERQIFTALDQIESATRREQGLADEAMTYGGVEQVTVLRGEVIQAFAAIRASSDLILAGDVERGRREAIDVLEGRVDSRIATLIEEAIASERRQLVAAQAEIERLNQIAKTLAWVSVLVALGLSAYVLIALVRRFSRALRQLDHGVREYADDNLTHRIDLPGRDELSAVAARLTDMASQLLAKRRALEAAQAELERRVEERTRELSELNAELEERERLRRQFFADVGHELRTPVTAIRGEAEVALRARGGADAARAEALTRIVSITEQLTQQVGDLFLVAREQAGVLDFRKDPVDLNEPVATGIEQLLAVAGKTGARVSLRRHEAALPIEGDDARLAQLVRILITNALTHAREGVEIDVETGLEGDQAVLSVSDDGPGIPKRDWERVFDRYVKGTSKSGKAAPGSGLGLAIAKSITQAHGGAISVSASRAGGARIAARFPVTEAV